MKKISFTLFLSSLCFFVDAQWSPTNIVTFDSLSFPYSGLLTIDTANYHHNIWQIGKPNKSVFTSAYSLPNAIVTDTLHPYPINDTSVFIIKMPFEVPAGGGFIPIYDLRFNYALNIDSNSIAKVELSEDNGMHWFNTKDTLPPTFFWYFKPDLTHSTTGWTLFDLDGNTTIFNPSDSFLFRFTFISDSVFANKDGWIIDDIYLNYYVEGVPQTQSNNPVCIYPNPAFTQLTISDGDKITSVAICNLIGQTLYSQQFNSSKVEIDVSTLPPGLYLIKINNTEVRKFVKQ